ncbi:MAG: class I SAM-dependent methyltransferase [Desulfosporosinus sp.]|nr:class I SAM-dependent methyltransferase [Desulfosporosinus sp.]
MDKTNKTIETYNLHASDFELKFMDFESYNNKVKDFCKMIKSQARVLDIGCGPGNVAKILAESEKKFEVLGIDLSSEMIKRASVNVISPRVHFLVCDIRSMGLERKEYDAVIASFCLPHLTNNEAAKLIKDVSLVLVKGGFLYLSCMEGSKSGFETTSFSPNEVVFFNYYSEEFIQRELTKNNLRTIKLQREIYNESDGSETTDMFFFIEKSI